MEKYYAVDDVMNTLYHHRYISRKMGPDGKFQYIYPEDVKNGSGMKSGKAELNGDQKNNGGNADQLKKTNEEARINDQKNEPIKNDEKTNSESSAKDKLDKTMSNIERLMKMKKDADNKAKKKKDDSKSVNKEKKSIESKILDNDHLNKRNKTSKNDTNSKNADPLKRKSAKSNKLKRKRIEDLLFGKNNKR